MILNYCHNLKGEHLLSLIGMVAILRNPNDVSIAAIETTCFHKLAIGDNKSNKNIQM